MYSRARIGRARDGRHREQVPDRDSSQHHAALGVADRREQPEQSHGLRGGAASETQREKAGKRKEEERRGKKRKGIGDIRDIGRYGWRMF